MQPHDIVGAQFTRSLDEFFVPHPVGIVDIVVDNGAGTATKSSAFTFEATQPTIASVSPTTGPASGSTLVTITGTHFLSGGASSVYFGNTQANGVTIVNDTTITAYALPHAAGVVDVAVGSVLSDNVLLDAFTYTP